jgi:hypothetical protein
MYLNLIYGFIIYPSYLYYWSGYELDSPGFDCRQGQKKKVSTPHRPDRFWDPLRSPIQFVPRTIFLGVKRPRREADHSPPTIAEVKNKWISTSTPPYVYMVWCLISYAQGQLCLTLAYCYYYRLNLRQYLHIRLHSVEWQDDWWIMNWKGLRRKRSWPNSSDISLERVKKITRSLSQYSRCTAEISNEHHSHSSLERNRYSNMLVIIIIQHFAILLE